MKKILSLLKLIVKNELLFGLRMYGYLYFTIFRNH